MTVPDSLNFELAGSIRLVEKLPSDIPSCVDITCGPHYVIDLVTNVYCLFTTWGVLELFAHMKEDYEVS